MPQPRIKIYTRSFDLRLYRLAKGLFCDWKDAEGEPIPCVRLTDQTADGFFAMTDAEVYLGVLCEERLAVLVEAEGWFAADAEELSKPSKQFDVAHSTVASALRKLEAQGSFASPFGQKAEKHFRLRFAHCRDMVVDAENFFHGG